MAWDESKHPRDGDGRFSENPHERDEKKRDAVRHIYDSDDQRERSGSTNGADSNGAHGNRSKAKQRIDAARIAQARDPEHSPTKITEHKPDHIAGVKRGNPMTFEQADGKSVNPYFEASYKDGTLYGYADNCAACVVAFEARRRGYDVRALPLNKNDYMQQVSDKTTLAWIDPRTGMSPIGRKIKRGEDKLAFLKNNVKEGGRYNLSFYREGSKYHHIVSVEKKNGHVFVYDPQTGEIFRDVNKYLTKCSDFYVLRVDTLAFNPIFVNKILKGNKK